jgi:hypothetical protein
MMREFERVQSRRDFLRRSFLGTVAASAALIVGEEVFEALERLAPRSLFAGWESPYYKLKIGESVGWGVDSDELFARMIVNTQSLSLQEMAMSGVVPRIIGRVLPLRTRRA